MISMYVTAVSLNYLTFEQVPDHWKEAVAKELGIDYTPEPEYYLRAAEEKPEEK